MVATCNGLVCLSDDILEYTNQYYVWNPCVRKYVKLPYPNFSFKNRDEFIHSIGFGFDPKTNDYKVVRMVSLRDDPDCRKDRPTVEVYTLSTGEWRTVTPVLSPICILHECETPAFVNGALHWIGFRRNEYDDYQLRYFVLVFNLGDEVFHEISLPELPEYNPNQDSSELSVVNRNSIALFHENCFRGFLDIWVMREYGVASSWTKVFTFTEHNPEVDLPLALGFRRNSELVLEMQSLQLVSLDLGNQNMKDLGINTYSYTFVGSYVESLVLLDKAANGAVTN